MRRRWLLLAELFFLAGLCAWLALSLIDRAYRPEGSVEVKVQLQGAKDKAYLFAKNGEMYYLIYRNDGALEYLNPEDFARWVHYDQSRKSWAEMVLNISSPAGMVWVGVGLLGQVLFTGRMLVQWIVSEKKNASVVPPVFWWMSLVGATMLLVYFLWRQDPVGVLGQAFGWFIYIRNLWMIYRPSAHAPVPPSLADDPASETQVGQ